MTIAEGRDASFHWLLRAKDLLGNADITVTAESGGKTSSLASHLEHPSARALSDHADHRLFQGRREAACRSRASFIPQYRKVTALASPLPQGLTRGLGEYLEHYAYGCTEQLVSKAFPTLVSAETMQQGLAARRGGEEYRGDPRRRRHAPERRGRVRALDGAAGPALRPALGAHHALHDRGEGAGLRRAGGHDDARARPSAAGRERHADRFPRGAQPGLRNLSPGAERHGGDQCAGAQSPLVRGEREGQVERRHRRGLRGGDLCVA